MGLDIVELVMRVEEEFNIEITDAEAEKLVTVGTIADCVTKKLNTLLEEQLEIWRRLQAAISDQHYIPLEKITRALRLVEDLRLD